MACSVTETNHEKNQIGHRVEKYILRGEQGKKTEADEYTPEKKVNSGVRDAYSGANKLARKILGSGGP